MPTPSIIPPENPFSEDESIYSSDSNSYNDCSSEHESDYGSDHESDSKTANSVDRQMSPRSEVKTSSPQLRI